MSHHIIRESNTSKDYGVNVTLKDKVVQTNKSICYVIEHNNKEYRFHSYREFTRFIKKNKLG